MALSDNRICVFCGLRPLSKNKEHIVPDWLQKATGDPRRSVPFGYNYRSNEIIKHSWSTLVAPACKSCNDHFSKLENRVKPVVFSLMERKSVTVASYLDLLDWLDKVRVGIWLFRHMIEGFPSTIDPHFHIANRVGQKDRMIALYVFDSKNKGINLFGSDSLIFNTMPSCFGLRINNILMLNISTDFFCSKGCGLPSPRSIKLLMSNNEGKIKYEGVEYAQEISNPITDLKIFKPVVWLYQPIKQPTDDPIFHGGYYGHLNLSDSRIMSRTLDNNDRLGALFRQYNDRIEILKDPNVVVNFDSVTGDECAAQKDIAASVYKLQASLWSAIEYETIESDKMVSTIKLDHDAKLRDAEMRAKMYLELGTQNH